MSARSFVRVFSRWAEVGRRTAAEVVRDDVMGWAAGLAFFFFLALFPALLFLVALAGSLPIQHLGDEIVGAISRFAPGDVVTIIRDQLEQIRNSDHGGLLTVGLIGTVWSASSGMSSAMNALNQAYHVTERRPWWRVQMTAMLLTAALAAFVLLSFALVLVGPAVADTIARMVGLGPAFTWTWRVLQWPVVAALIMTGLGFVYYIGPDVQQTWTRVVPGALVATTLWLLASLGFKWYIASFAGYQKTYGAIGGVMVTLLWFYVSALAMLVGAELNAVMSRASTSAAIPGERTPAPPGTAHPDTPASGGPSWCGAP